MNFKSLKILKLGFENFVSVLGAKRGKVDEKWPQNDPLVRVVLLLEKWYIYNSDI